MLKEATQYILDKHFAYYDCGKTDITLRLEKCERRELIFITSEYLTPYLTFIKENRRIFRLAIKQFHVMNMDKVYNEMFKYIFEPILMEFGVPSKERTYIMKFYLTGVFAIVLEWIEGNCEEELDFVIKIIMDCVMGARNLNV